VGRGQPEHSLWRSSTIFSRLLKGGCAEVEFVNTICKPTKDPARPSAKALSQEVGRDGGVGAITAANTHKLADVARAAFRQREHAPCGDGQETEDEWFEGKVHGEA